MLIEDLNPAFLIELIDIIEGIYPDTYEAMTKDPGLGETQAKSVLGHYRRGRAETALQRAAVKYGVRQADVQPQGGGISHIGIYLGRFQLAMCHVPSQDAFPQHSFDREESSKANEYIAQMDMLSESEPEPPAEHSLFGVIIHSEESRNKGRFGHIKIGFPDIDFTKWEEEPICLLEIRDIHAMRYQKKEDLQGLVQKPEVRWKTDSLKSQNDRKSEGE